MPEAVTVRPEQHESFVELDGGAVRVRLDHPDRAIPGVEHGRVEIELIVDPREFLVLIVEQRLVFDLDKAGTRAHPRIDQASGEDRPGNPFERLVIAVADNARRRHCEGFTPGAIS